MICLYEHLEKIWAGEILKEDPRVSEYKIYSLVNYNHFSLWLTHFTDWLGTPLKRGKWLAAAFQKDSVQIRETCRLIGKRELRPLSSKDFGIIEFFGVKLL
jgi:hypothetical protein